MTGQAKLKILQCLGQSPPWLKANAWHKIPGTIIVFGSDSACSVQEEIELRPQTQVLQVPRVKHEPGHKVQAKLKTAQK